MSDMRAITIDGNQAIASVAYRINEVIAIYPITPSSGMGELSDAWSARGQRNLWVELQNSRRNQIDPRGYSAGIEANLLKIVQHSLKLAGFYGYLTHTTLYVC